jgi:hypothetical protein
MNPLKFPLQQQFCTEWCWAAVAAAVCACYKDDDAPDQRGVVSLVNQDDSGNCTCNTDSSLTCNQPHDLSVVLAAVNHLGDELEAPQFSDITAEIDRGHPIVVQVEFAEAAASGHAVAIYGYTTAGSVYIADPMHAEDTITATFDDLVCGTSSSYHGTWRTAFKTISR